MLHIKAFKFQVKLYIPSALKTQTNLVPFCFWANWVVRGNTENFHNFAGVYTAIKDFFAIFIDKTITKIELLYIVASAIKSSLQKSEKTVIVGFKVYF